MSRGALGGPVLAFERVTRIFRDAGATRVALAEVSFALEPGSLVALTGENGSGKSTLLRLAATLDEPTLGRVTIDGQEGARARQDVGYLGQDAGLYQALTARENLDFAARFHGRGGDVAPIAARLGVDLARPARLLSRGERQRVAVARAFLGGDVLLLDEPTTALDAEARSRLLGLLDERGARTALVATHDADLVAKADRVLTLREGRLS